MNCEKYLILIDDLIDGELDDRNAGLEINSHLLICSQCANYYQTARREKEIYSAYLSGIEPPADLWTKFQTKINSEVEAAVPVTEITAKPDWRTNFFKFFRLAPAIGFTVLLIVLGFSLLKFEPDKNEYAVQNKSNDLPPISENYTEQSPKLTAETDTRKINDSPKSEFIDTNKVLNRDTINRTVKKATKTNGKSAFDSNRKESADQIQLDKRLLELTTLEKDTARQIEKTELLLRAFRNARTTEDDSSNDLEYERQQSRKLLEKNVQLRQIAESYGNLYAQELLDRIEPFLLDIANLEKDHSSEKILDIQNRVKNQNIIASLQTY